MASEDEKDSDSKKQETDNDDEEGKLRWPDDEVWSDDEDLEETEDSEEANDVDVVEDPDLDDADEEDELSEAEVAAINEEAQNEELAADNAQHSSPAYRYVYAGSEGTHDENESADASVGAGEPREGSLSARTSSVSSPICRRTLPG